MKESGYVVIAGGHDGVAAHMLHASSSKDFAQ